MTLFWSDPALMIATMLKELLLAVGLGLVSIALTAKDGRIKHLAGVGVMIILSVLPDALVAVNLRFSHIDWRIKFSLPDYFRGQAPMFVLRISIGYLIGVAIWVKKIRAKPLSRPGE